MPKIVNHVEEIIAFVLENVANRPAPTQIKMYRALAHICGDEAECRKLNRMANTLSSAEKQYRQFKFNFSQRGEN
jgi:hypothetical protein